MKKEEKFINVFNPYRNKYIYQRDDGLFDDAPCWHTANEYLSKKTIRKAILEQLIVGYFITNVPNVLGIDIDDHRGRAWKGQNPSPLLLSLYDQTTKRLHTYPSLLVQSPRGLHAYWVLTERIPVDILSDIALQKLKGIPVEIKPTATTAMRIPAEKRFLEPKTFDLLNIPFELWAQDIQAYHPATLFYCDYLPGVIFESLKQKNFKKRVLKHIPQIERVEDDVLPFENGNTNEAFLKLCQVYRCAGYTIDGALDRFQLCLLKSPGYSGDLHDEKRLRGRIQSEYKKNKNNYKPEDKPVQIDLFQEVIVENIVKGHPFVKQRTEPLKRFVRAILSWCDMHDEVFKDKRRTAWYDYAFPYYRKNRREGLYPLSRNFLQKANQRYFELMPWLKGIGFIEKSDYKYSQRLHICKYYKVNKDAFL